METAITTERSPTPPSQPQPDFTSKYKEVNGANQIVEGKKWSTEWVLSEYTKCTDGIIGKMDGTIPLRGVSVYEPGENGLNKVERDLPPPVAVLYLDKSARPVQWAVRELWSQLARVPGTKYSEGEVPPRLREFFLNIDKGDWLRRMGVPPEEIEDAPDELIDISKIEREQITRIRALFSTEKISEDNLEEAWDYPTIFDGQHVMIVDEVRSSGQTLNLAQMLLASAIPEATFSGQYWAEPTRIALNRGTEVGGKMQYKIEWVPTWYNPHEASGRGISDRDPLWPELSERAGDPISEMSKVGRHVLSTPPHDPLTYERTIDKKAGRVREDFKQLASDLAEHKILYRPSPDRPFDDDSDFEALVERIEALNGTSYKEWQTKRKEMEPKAR